MLDQPLPALLPFVPVLRNGGNEPAIRQALVQLRANEELNELEPLLAFFASYVLDMPLVQQMMRWDMVVLRQSPWYHEILEEGRQEGRQEGLREALSRLLEHRFGPLPEDLLARLAQLTPEQLIDLELVAAEAASLAEFQDHLPA